MGVVVNMRWGASEWPLKQASMTREDALNTCTDNRGVLENTGTVLTLAIS